MAAAAAAAAAASPALNALCRCRDELLPVAVAVEDAGAGNRLTASDDPKRTASDLVHILLNDVGEEELGMAHTPHTPGHPRNAVSGRAR